VGAVKDDVKSWQSYISFHRMKRQGLLGEDLKRVPAEGGAYAPAWNDMENIYHLIRKRKPKVILELGGGYSTNFFARALRDNHKETGEKGKLYSFDGSEFWLDITAANLAKAPDLLDYVEFHVGVEESDQMGEYLVSKSTNLPQEVPNFIYVDGLSTIKNSVNGEVLHYEQDAPEDFFVLVDGRKKSVGAMQALLKRKYSIVHNSFHYRTTFELQD
jgi:hypothetical protein